MNPTLELIHHRRSVRAFTDQPLSQAEKDTITQAAMRAPTAGNMLLYSIIEVDDQALKDRLARTCDNQPFIARSPYVLLFLADYQRWFDYFKLSHVEQRCQELGRPYRTPQVGDMLLGCCDALIAAQTAVIAAESLGLGSCYIGDILEQYEIHRQLFALPRYVLPITLICFGHPTTESRSGRQTPRFDREFIVHQNTYKPLQPADYERMFQPSIERFSGPYIQGAENIGQHQYFRKFNADYAIELNRSARKYLEDWE